jgi:hypothetical protein
MNLVSCNTVEELKTMMAIIFWPDPERFTDIGEITLEFEDILNYLEVVEDDLLPVGLAPHSEQYYEAIDSLTVDDIKRYVLDEGNHPAIQNFVPCVVIWRFEDSWDRMGDVIIRVFVIKPQSEMTPAAWIEQYDAYQKERTEQYELYKDVEERLQRLNANQMPS